MSDGLGSEYGRLTAAVSALVDPAFEASSPSPEPEAFKEALLKNKFSRELLEGTDFPAPGASVDRRHREDRQETRDVVEDRLEAAGVDYVTMKELRGTKVLQHDVDILVPNVADEAAIIRTLEELGYAFYRFRLLAHPQKVMARRSPDDQSPVDLYPAAMWIRKHVCDGREVVRRSRTAGAHEPTPEDDLYLVATHAFAHLDVRLAEVYHGVTILEESDDFDWEYLVDTACRWGCEDALYGYLNLVDRHLSITDRARVPERILERLASTRINRITDSWLSGLTEPLEYPVKIPVWAGTIASSFHHVPRVASLLGIREACKDLQTHYLAAASELVLGET